MNTGSKKKQIITPETIGGACMTGKYMTKQEEIEMERWVAVDKAKHTAAQIQSMPAPGEQQTA